MNRTLFLLLTLAALTSCRLRQDTLMQNPSDGRQVICYADAPVTGISDHDVCVRNFRLKGWVVVKSSLAY